MGRKGSSYTFPVFPSSYLSLVKILSIEPLSPPYLWFFWQLLGCLELLWMWPGQVWVLELLQLLWRWGWWSHVKTPYLLLEERRQLILLGGETTAMEARAYDLGSFWPLPRSLCSFYGPNATGLAAQVLFLQRNIDAKVFYEV